MEWTSYLTEKERVAVRRFVERSAISCISRGKRINGKCWRQY